MTGKRPRGFCPVCGDDVPLYEGGRVGRHRGSPGKAGCAGERRRATAVPVVVVHKGPSRVRVAMLNTRLTPREMCKVKTDAAAHHMTASEWVRSRLGLPRVAQRERRADRH